MKSALACLALLAALAALLALSACGAGNSIPSSSISMYNAATNTLIAAPGTIGFATIKMGESFQFKVVRLTFDSEQNGHTDTSDVTTVCDYTFDHAGIATANNIGVIYPIAPGQTRMMARFKPTATDPSDRVFIDVTVMPADAP